MPSAARTPSLTSALGTYVAQRAKEHSTELDAALFLTRTSTPVARNTAEHLFSRLRVRAGVLRHDGSRYQPRLHDLRHAAAVHRVVSWYRRGAGCATPAPTTGDLPRPCQYRCHPAYLTLTPELLHEASQRFEHYAQGGQHE